MIQKLHWRKGKRGEENLTEKVNSISYVNLKVKICNLGASLVVQQLGIHLPMRGTQVHALVQEDPTCLGATKPVRHNYWAHVPQLLKPVCLEPVLRNKRNHRNEKPVHRNRVAPCSPQLEKACAQQRRPNAAKNKLINFKKRMYFFINLNWCLKF